MATQTLDNRKLDLIVKVAQIDDEEIIRQLEVLLNRLDKITCAKSETEVSNA